MHLKPIKKRFFIELNLIWLLVFSAIFAIILYSVNPFEASIFTLIIFYLVLFCLLLGIFSLTRLFVKTPYWLIILLALCVIFILLILAN
jgi:glucan phosphoethanolaminetransferase (alkaline phosphatase superfamily)